MALQARMCPFQDFAGLQDVSDPWFYFVKNHSSEIQVEDLSLINPNVLGACLECLYYPASDSLHNNYEHSLKLDSVGPVVNRPSTD